MAKLPLDSFEIGAMVHADWNRYNDSLHCVGDGHEERHEEQEKESRRGTHTNVTKENSVLCRNGHLSDLAL